MPAEQRCWRKDLYDQIRGMMFVQGGLSIDRMCRLADVSRAGCYRSYEAKMPAEDEVKVRALVQEIVLAHWQRYGYRRVTAELHRRGLVANHKRVARIMREDNLLTVRPVKDFGSQKPGERFEVYLNLAARMKVTGLDQLWVADITYVRLNREFVYLAVVLDAFSRKVVGWELNRTLATRLPLTALNRAIEARRPLLGLVHHSDQGIQYRSSDYRNLLKKYGMFPSISRPRTPLDNANCESFMRTLKREEIQVGVFQSLEELRANIKSFIEHYYNAQRLHSALGYRPPEEFEKTFDPGGSGHTPNGALLSI
jgi:putative transposase